MPARSHGFVAGILSHRAARRTTGPDENQTTHVAVGGIIIGLARRRSGVLHLSQICDETRAEGQKAMAITVYSKPACVQCTATTRALDAKGISYNVIDLTEDAEAMEKVMAMGYRQAPVVIAGEAHWAGFRPDMIGQIAS